jgi:predicted aldo/keto reductase-like oxidoreductase
MKYRTFGKLPWKPSALGFGAMRLPVIDGDTSRIDEPEATRMIRYAIDHGVNYVDTAYPYHQQNSERFLGRALQDGYRQRIRLATKMPSNLINEAADFDRILNEQLERLQTDHLDFYLFHGMNKKRWLKLSGLDVLGWAERAMADGRFHHLGFSFHDSFEVFREIVDATDLWTLCQIQYNYMDEEYQAGTRGLKYAAGKGLAVVVMEPIRGGRLARNIPPVVRELWDGGATWRTPADLALQWVWDHPEVSVVLSGMSTFQQVKENLESADQSGPGTLTEGELALIAQARDEYRALCPIPCTECRYCLPCPSGVNIPRIFEIYNELIMYSDKQRAQLVYGWLNDDERADMCIECGDCLDKCPQQIEVPDWLKQARALICQD